MQAHELNMSELHWLMDMLHNIDVGLVVLDKEFNIQVWNGFMENHSGLLPDDVKNKSLFKLFPEIPEQWFLRRAESVNLVKNKSFTIWEQRPYLIRFKNYRPITGVAEFMYQNTTMFPLLSTTGEVSHYCVIIYDVTDVAVSKLAIEKANQVLDMQSKTDGLTQLFNRAHWEDCLRAEYKRWRRSKHPTSMIILDIDHFKRINDSYGHLVGDAVIRDLSKILRDEARETDMVGRYGGEEFTLLLPDTSSVCAHILAERIRRIVEKHSVAVDDFIVKYTVSIGIAQVEEKMDAYEKWIEAADSALYFSKENGRNKITLFDAMP